MAGEFPPMSAELRAEIAAQNEVRAVPLCLRCTLPMRAVGTAADRQRQEHATVDACRAEAAAAETADMLHHWDSPAGYGGVPAGQSEVPRCDDCGIPTEQHGEECGYYAGDPRGPEYGRPAGWVSGPGEFYPVDSGDRWW